MSTIVYANVTVFNLIVSLVIILVAFIASRFISVYLRRILKEKIEKSQLEILTKIIKYGIIVLAVIFILPNMGIKLSGLMVAGGIFGLAIGFASQSIIGNLISGLFLFIERPLKIGDGVNIGGSVGMVEDIRIMSTTLRQYDGLFLRVPNQKVFTSNLTNFVAHVARRFVYNVGIRYEDDADRAIEIIKGLINDHPLALANPEPNAFVDELGDNAVVILVRIWAPSNEYFAVKMELLLKIKKTLEENGIEIAFPQRTVWFANQPAPELPETIG
jgi:small-conductance mechanosensitive channel